MQKTVPVAGALAAMGKVKIQLHWLIWVLTVASKNSEVGSLFGGIGKLHKTPVRQFRR